MLEISFALLLILAMFSFVDWRKGLSACVLMGIIQDPLRKLVLNEPAYFVVHETKESGRRKASTLRRLPSKGK